MEGDEFKCLFVPGSVPMSRLDNSATLFRVPGTPQLQIPLPSPSQTTRFMPGGRSKESRQGENGGSVEQPGTAPEPGSTMGHG